MASKGIIHRNAAGRYKSRLTTRIARKASPASRSTRPYQHCRGRHPLPATQLDDQPLEQDARVAGRPLEVEVGPEQRVDRRADVRRRERRKLGPHQPSELAEDLFRRRAGVEHQRQLAQRFGGRARPRSRWSSPSRPAAPPVPTTARTSSTVIVLLPERVEQQPIDVAAQPLDVRCRRARRAAAPPPARCCAPAAATRVRTQRSASARSSSAPHSTIVACFCSSLNIRLRLSSARRDQHQRRLRLGAA